MLCREIIALCFKNRTKHTNVLCVCVWGGGCRVLVLRQVLRIVRLYFKELNSRGRWLKAYIIVCIVACRAVIMKWLRDGQRLSKHVPAETECFYGDPCQEVISKGRSQLKFEFCTGVCEERTWAREAEESPVRSRCQGMASEGLEKA
jgi:hypothetical protein